MNERTEPTSQELEQARKTLEKILLLMDTGSEVEARLGAEEGIALHITTDDPGRIIGREAQVLNALQFILNRMLFKEEEWNQRCEVDVEQYRERRREKIKEQALIGAERVRSTGRPLRLDPMPSAERKMVHNMFAEDPDLRTESEEEEYRGMKRLVIYPAESTGEEIVDFLDSDEDQEEEREK